MSSTFPCSRSVLKFLTSLMFSKNIDHLSIDLNQDLTYRERPLKILEADVRVTRRRAIKFYKVQWTNHSEEEATWDAKIIFEANFQTSLVPKPSKSRDEIYFKGGRICNIPKILLVLLFQK